jgi:hypothetical protein
MGPEGFNPNIFRTAGGPSEPTSDARQFARFTHDHFVALIGEGFTEDQAMRIIGMLFRANRSGE